MIKEYVQQLINKILVYQVQSGYDNDKAMSALMADLMIDGGLIKDPEQPQQQPKEAPKPKKKKRPAPAPIEEGKDAFEELNNLGEPPKPPEDDDDDDDDDFY